MGDARFADLKMKCPNANMINYTDFFADFKEFAKGSVIEVVSLPCEEIDKQFRKMARVDGENGEQIINFEFRNKKYRIVICSPEQLAEYKRKKTYEAEVAKYPSIVMLAFHHRLRGKGRFDAWAEATGAQFGSLNNAKLKKCNDIYKSIHDRVPYQ